MTILYAKQEQDYLDCLSAQVEYIRELNRHNTFETNMSKVLAWANLNRILKAYIDRQDIEFFNDDALAGWIKCYQSSIADWPGKRKP